MSALPTILVTAAAGKTGRHTALSLLSRGFPVRAMVHRDDARSAALRQRGAEVVVGNVSDVNDVRAALHGVQRAYWAAPGYRARWRPPPSSPRSPRRNGWKLLWR